MRIVRLFLYLILFISSGFVYTQPLIYTDQVNLITGIWQGNGTLTQTNQDGPLEGNLHYRFSYNFDAWWSGFGLNMDNWGSSSGINFSTYTYISVSYKGLTGAEYLQLRLRSGGVQSNDVVVGYDATGYQTVLIPLGAFSGVNLNNITEVIFSVSGLQASSGNVFLDDIKLTTIGAPPYAGQNANHTSARTWMRYAKMNKGINLSNWLEAYWLIPYNAFPETNKYNRSNIQKLVDMGFKNIRMPVTFERVAAASPPYTIPANHEVWRLIDSAVVWARDLDFTLIICNHHGYDITNVNYVSELPRKQAIWQQILNRYDTLNPDRFFFELFNEPTNEISNSNLRAFYLPLIQFIRNIVPDHTLIIGGNNWNSKTGLTGLVTLGDQDIIYTFHDYDPWLFTHAGMSWTSPPNMPVLSFPRPGFPNDIIDLINSIKVIKTWADTSGVPVILGEFGVSTSAAAPDRCNWIQTISFACQDNSIPWFYWDGISNSDAFGFINVPANSIIPCFADTLNLGTSNICNKIVTNVSDYGLGSLRNALMCAEHGDTITFHPSIAGDTIFLSSFSIGLTKNVILRNDNPIPVVIAPLYPYPNFLILSGVNARFENLHLLTKVSGSLHGPGNLTLKNVEIKTGNMDFNMTGQGIIYIEGNVVVKQ